MIYYTGDIHGDPYEVIQFCDSKKLTEQDTLVLLGDVGANYYRNRRDTEMKKVLAAVCRHVYYKYPALVGEHTALFRLQFEETEDGDTDTEEVKT